MSYPRTRQNSSQKMLFYRRTCFNNILGLGGVIWSWQVVPCEDKYWGLVFCVSHHLPQHHQVQKRHSLNWPEMPSELLWNYFPHSLQFLVFKWLPFFFGLGETVNWLLYMSSGDLYAGIEFVKQMFIECWLYTRHYSTEQNRREFLLFWVS